MFILRTISPAGEETNYTLGVDYSTLFKWNTPEKFNEVFKRHFGWEPEEESRNVIAFILGGAKSIPIHDYEEAYIMTNDGKTFSCLNKSLTKK